MKLYAFTHYCSICGDPLSEGQISRFIWGHYVRFEERDVGKCKMSICEECDHTMLLRQAGGLVGAIDRYVKKHGTCLCGEGNP